MEHGLNVDKRPSFLHGKGRCPLRWQKPIISVLLVVSIAVLLGWVLSRRQQTHETADTNWEHRVVFVCCDSHGTYSPGVYTRVGGGRVAFKIVREAAPFMRAGDPGSAAAGLCAFLFRDHRYQGDTGGTLVLIDPPQAGSDKKVDWKNYHADADVILINVDTGSAKCCYGTVKGMEINNLSFGDSQK
jgi:hypothetical protein